VATVDKSDGDAPTLEHVRSVLTQRAPRGLEARSLNWSSYFRIQHRQVAHMQDGRIFVAGDAAHIHSPFRRARHEHGPSRRLESYTAEREPIIRDVIETTHLITRALGTASRFAMS
jgi:hypothetical protein